MTECVNFFFSENRSAVLTAYLLNALRRTGRHQLRNSLALGVAFGVDNLRFNRSVTSLAVPNSLSGTVAGRLFVDD